MAQDLPPPGEATDDIDEAWRRLNPVKPLPSNSPWYVDCAEERGISNFVERIVGDMRRATSGTSNSAFLHDLVVGHRGSGKSTELLRVKARLEEEGFYVHYVDIAEEMEISRVDCEAVLTVALRCLIADLEKLGIKLQASLLQQVAEWYGNRVKVAVGTRSAQIGADVKAGLGSPNPIVKLFAGLTGTMRWATETKDSVTTEYNRFLSELRDQVEPLLTDASLKLQERTESPQGLAIIVDSLDHIELKAQQDEVFIQGADILAPLTTHLILTMPDAVLVTGQGGAVERRFTKCHLLPVVKIRSVSGERHQPGLDVMARIIGERCNTAELFEPDALERICIYSGGHPRHLIRLAQDAISDAGTKPVTLQSANRAVASLSNLLAAGRTPTEWQALARVERDPFGRPFSDEGRSLLYYNCILSHENAQEEDAQGIASQWYVVHPCLRRLKPFRDAVAALEAETE